MTAPPPRPSLRHRAADSLRSGAAAVTAAALLVPLVLVGPVGATGLAPRIPSTIPAVDPAAAPSAHYLDALEHELEVLEFEPGERVTIPFQPRASDRWPIGGSLPRALPAGYATGAEMRAAPADAAWSIGAPPDLRDPGSAEPSLEGVDQDGGATGSLATGTSWSASTGDENVAAAAVGENGLRREVFGFLPYWEVSGSVDLDYRTLST
ncbi:MAG TPA: hypothetical protein VK831_02225, partial [Candidatus Deferrimicrobiaceae bacterium]|nr:hypothetical protein [Candidatus Deferrimicrobiaceae bacterium]